MLNLANAHGRCGALRLNLYNGHTSQILSVLAVKSNEISSSYAELDQDGVIYLCKYGQKRQIVNNALGIVTWDCDPVAGVVVFLRSVYSQADNIVYIQGRHCTKVYLGDYYCPIDVWIDPHQRYIWVCVTSIDQTFRTLAYNYAGKLIGEGPSSAFPLHAPIYSIGEPLARAISHLPAAH